MGFHQSPYKRKLIDREGKHRELSGKSAGMLPADEDQFTPVESSEKQTETTRAQSWFDYGANDARSGHALCTDFEFHADGENYRAGYQSVARDGVGQEPSGIDGVKKYDAGKAPIMQGVIGRFPLALEQIALVSEYGKRKYGTYDGWEKLPEAFMRYEDALGRHTLLRGSEGEYDVKDSGLPHLAQRAWNALATLEIALRENIIKMTPGNEIDEDARPVLGSNGRTNEPS